MRVRRTFRVCLGVSLAAAAAYAVPSALRADPAPPAAAKKVVRTQDDLPRFSYPIQGTAAGLLTSDDATFAAFSGRVGSDIDTVLAGYDIQDRATLRSLLGVKAAIAILSGDDPAALGLLGRIRELEDKPDAKLLSGLRSESYIAARKETGQSSGPALEAAFARIYAARLAPLPWAVVADRIKEAKSGAELISEPLIVGSVKAGIEPAVAQTHALSGELAWGLISQRMALRTVIPVKAALTEVLARDVAANDVRKPDIWAERDVELDAHDRLTPVRVAIWDSGSDLALFPGRVYTDPRPTPTADPHGLAFDLEGLPTHGALLGLSPEQARAYPAMLSDLKGFSDLQLSIDSPEAAALRKKLSGLSAAEVPGFLEQLEFFSIYIHGTHVAGIAARGNPAIRLAVGRITFDWRNVPEKPTETLARRAAADDQAYVRWFRAHGVRVVNMSWGGNPGGYESALEKNGVGKSAEERKAIARRLFAIERDGLLRALASAPDILFVCAAGNDDSDSGFNEFIPSSFKLPNLLTVAAVDQAGDEASFTSYGATVRVDANGYQVDSVVPGGARLRLSGTSMASPNTANLAAKLLAVDPKLKPVDVIRLIVDTATPSPDGRRRNIDPKRALAELKSEMAAGRL